MKQIKFIIDEKEFIADLNSSYAANELWDLLPLSLPFTEKGGYEYYCYIDHNLTSEPIKPDFGEAGSLMLYLQNYVAIFYNNLENPVQSYTPLGKLQNIEGLKEALDAGYKNIQIEKYHY